MRKIKEVEIEGYRYEVRQLRATDSILLMPKIAKLIAPLTKGLKVPKGTKPSMESIIAAFGDLDIGSVLENLTENLDSPVVWDIIQKMFACVKPLNSTVENENGEMVEFKVTGQMLKNKKEIDDHFDNAGLKAMLLLIKDCLEVNYGDFLPESA